ncbi:uncharacterized protein LOC143266094 isoform X2 [Megachile rotundata]|uniref:uncharacterized protein LOC143266094 isoform X2 n=1 Tax=Megachile rotundata TaxID=143995 RepID=UPI003FD4F9F6
MRMQPGVTVVLATVWLYANVVGTASLNSSRFSLDQYSPLAPHHELYQRVGGQLDWKDQSPVGNQPFDLPIDPRRSSSASPWQSFESKYLDKDPFLARTRGNSAADDFSPLVEDKRHRKEFTERKIDGTKDPDQPAGALSELEDPFVADDTFQDQGPGSMEIYKLDLLREKSLLSSTPLTRYLLKGKGKAPKKTNVAWKTKTDFKSTSPKMFHKQSNSFDDLSTEVPPNSDPFSIGGVPELQVGCEGLEASDHKMKRSIEYRQRNTSPREVMDAMAGVTPISLDLDYDFSSIEEEEMDELLRLKKLETTTKGIKPNRGDMEATRYSDFDDKRLPEKLPVRGDLGKSNANSTGDQKTASDSDKPKREAEKSADSLVTAHQRRRILWFDESSSDEQVRNGGRPKRAIWGFGEDEGVVSSDELQTENQRRRQNYEWRRKEEERRRLEEAQRRDHTENRTNSEVERIRQEYERALEERARQEEERQRRLRQESRRRPQELADSRRYEPPSYEEERRRHEEAVRRQEEARRQREEQDRRNLEQRRREWMQKMRQAEEERRRQQSRNEPSNLLHPMRATPNESRPYYPEGRSREHSGHEQKLREYMQRNRPINPADREAELRRQEEERRRMEEERKLQDYIRRNQPVSVDESRDPRNRMTGPYNWSRYPGPDTGRRNHGPSAPTNIDPRSYVDERYRADARRMEEERQREQLRKEALRREEEARRLQSRRYEEQRKRLEAERREADRRRQPLIEEHARRSQAGRQENRPTYDDRIHFEEHRGRQDTSLIPANLVLNQSRRAMEMERQRQELQRQQQERWRLEAERRRQEDSRAKEAREREERARAMKEQWRRQEEARLNALPVSAKIIIQPAVGTYPRTNLTSRIGSGISFPDLRQRLLSPDSPGIPVPSAPAPTRRPPICASAVVQCCQSNSKRMVWCFEAMGCPGVNWDVNPCRISIINAAKQEIMKFYEESEGNN